MQQSWFLKKQFISMLNKYGISWKLFYLNVGVLWPGCTIVLSKLVKNNKNTGQKCMIGIIALLFLISLLTKKCKLVLHFFAEEDNYYCHCHIRFLVLITNELNLASDQISYSYPVNANSWYNTFCIDWCRERKMDLHWIKFRTWLTWKTLDPNYTLCSERIGAFPEGWRKNSENKISQRLRILLSPNPEIQLI